MPISSPLIELYVTVILPSAFFSSFTSALESTRASKRFHVSKCSRSESWVTIDFASNSARGDTCQGGYEFHMRVKANDQAQRPAPDAERGKQHQCSNYRDAPPKPRAGAGSLERLVRPDRL